MKGGKMKLTRNQITL